MESARSSQVLVAGGEYSATRALTRALHAHGLVVVQDATGTLDAVVIGAGADWREPHWRACLESVYWATAAALPLLAAGAVIVVGGPRVVSEPGAGYREYVKARFVLNRWRQELEMDAPTVTPVTMWGAGPETLARETISRLHRAGVAERA